MFMLTRRTTKLNIFAFQTLRSVSTDPRTQLDFEINLKLKNIRLRDGRK